MVKRLLLLAAFVGLSAATASAQDARAVLQASLKAMGGENLKTIQYSGAGWNRRSARPTASPETGRTIEVAAYTRAIDYDAKWSRETTRAGRAAIPSSAGVPMPRTHVTAILSGNYAWDMDGADAGSVHASVPRRRFLQRSCGSSNSR